MTSLVDMPVKASKGTNGGENTTPKPKMQIWIKKTEHFNFLMQWTDHTRNARGHNGKQTPKPMHAASGARAGPAAAKTAAK